MKIFNSQSRKKEELIPVDPGEVKIYSCGPTVYNYFHLGNARPFIMFDCLRTYLEYRGYKVKFVQNFTDVDDKMIKRANEEGISVAELADRFIAEYFVDARGLGVRPATVHPKATENIDAIIDIIRTLEDKGYAYAVDGDVYYRTSRFQDYGKLSHMPIEDLEAGARISVNDVKEDPLDFALWKAAKPGEPAWDSPWGKGRPGWHIECSAMAGKYLGKTIDIHCGGQDLTFPHHENEIAQSEAANGQTFAKYWMHNAYININNQKMSKSLGNFFTVRDVAQVFSYETIRFFMLSSHYRSPINYSEEILKASEAGLARLYNCWRNLDYQKKRLTGELRPNEAERLAELGKYRDAFVAAMDDDLNTADAIAAIFDLARELNTIFTDSADVSGAFCEGAEALFTELVDVLGIVRDRAADTADAEIEQLIEERQTARKARDFKTADAIRDKLSGMGIVLEDTPTGVKWHRS